MAEPPLEVRHWSHVIIHVAELIGLRGVPSGPPAERVPRGLAGFAVRVDDVDAAYRRALSLGVRCETEPTQIGGFRQFAVVDPDGVRVEISQPPAGLERFGPFSGRPAQGSLD